MKNLSLVLFAAMFVAMAQPVHAIAEFKKAFGARYTDKKKNEAYYTTVRKAGCYVCHVKRKGAKKEEQNAYGKLLNSLIKGDADDRIKAAKEKGTEEKKAEVKKLLEELDAAFTKLEKTKIKKDGKETWGDRIKASKLPVPLPPKTPPANAKPAEPAATTDSATTEEKKNE